MKGNSFLKGQMMKLGMGLYRHMLTKDNFRFAKQAGCSHIVAHLVNYFEKEVMPSTDVTRNWGATHRQKPLWSYEELRDLKKAISDEGLELYAIENFDPAHWHDILLDGPRKEEQVEGIKTIIRRMGKVGIPCMGYNFSIAGVWGHVRGSFARGGAETVAFVGEEVRETLIPKGQVWNMTYDVNAPQGVLSAVTSAQVWERAEGFLKALVPVAEEARVRLAIHPDDPPMPALRGMARLIHHPDHYQRLLDIVPSYYNSLEFCQGTTAEMGGDIYEAIDRYSRQGNIAYVHFRNVRGKVPRYTEVFVDEGDVDMVRAMRIYHKNGFDGVVIPDHTPSMACGVPWHAGMAFALGYIRGLIQTIKS